MKKMLLKTNIAVLVLVVTCSQSGLVYASVFNPDSDNAVVSKDDSRLKNENTLLTSYQSCVSQASLAKSAMTARQYGVNIKILNSNIDELERTLVVSSPKQTNLNYARDIVDKAYKAEKQQSVSDRVSVANKFAEQVKSECITNKLSPQSETSITKAVFYKPKYPRR